MRLCRLLLPTGFDRSKSYKKVPIATIENHHYFGSDEIVDGLIKHNPLLSDDAEFNGPAAKDWQAFCNNELAPLLYPNMSGTWSESYQAFQYIHQLPQFSSLQKMAIQSVGSMAMFMAANRVKSKLPTRIQCKQ